MFVDRAYEIKNKFADLFSIILWTKYFLNKIKIKTHYNWDKFFSNTNSLFFLNVYPDILVTLFTEENYPISILS